MSNPLSAGQFSKFYPIDASPAERVRIARREISLHVSSLKGLLSGLTKELVRLEKSPWPDMSSGGMVEEFYQLAVRNSQGIYRELHEVRRAVTEHLEQVKGGSPYE